MEFLISQLASTFKPRCKKTRFKPRCYWLNVSPKPFIAMSISKMVLLKHDVFWEVLI